MYCIVFDAHAVQLILVLSAPLTKGTCLKAHVVYVFDLLAWIKFQDCITNDMGIYLGTGTG